VWTYFESRFTTFWVRHERWSAKVLSWAKRARPYLGVIWARHEMVRASAFFGEANFFILALFWCSARSYYGHMPSPLSFFIECPLLCAFPTL
jgi:hypothetical protein